MDCKAGGEIEIEKRATPNINGSLFFGFEKSTESLVLRVCVITCRVLYSEQVHMVLFKQMNDFNIMFHCIQSDDTNGMINVMQSKSNIDKNYKLSDHTPQNARFQFNECIKKHVVYHL